MSSKEPAPCVKEKAKIPFITTETPNVELLYRFTHSANQLCVYGAVTDWCETLARTAAEIRNNSGKELTISSLTKIPRAPAASGELGAPENLVFRVTFTKKSTQIPFIREQDFYYPI